MLITSTCIAACISFSIIQSIYHTHKIYGKISLTQLPLGLLFMAFIIRWPIITNVIVMYVFMS